MIKGLAVIVNNEHEYKRMQDFLTKEVAYIDWQPQMAEVETAVIIWSSDKSFGVGGVGCTSYQAASGIQHVEFKNWFKNE